MRISALIIFLLAPCLIAGRFDFDCCEHYYPNPTTNKVYSDEARCIDLWLVSAISEQADCYSQDKMEALYAKISIGTTWYDNATPDTTNPDNPLMLRVCIRTLRYILARWKDSEQFANEFKCSPALWKRLISPDIRDVCAFLGIWQMSQFQVYPACLSQ